ncbi:MAG TPA: MmcQ/YjbR family DNA-binding protein [Kofleriaceae bacterium]|nr:MmcQ/YjbR family DNA-binding protein [Kofleriaceae bacterium]
MPITEAQIRKLALAYPEAIESSHFDVKDFRVRKKIFATIHPTGKTGVLLHIDPDQRAALAADEPETFQLRGTALQVVFARITVAQYKALLEQAWRGTAPKKLVAAYDAER